MSSGAPDFQKTPEDVEYEGQVIKNDEAQILKVGSFTQIIIENMYVNKTCTSITPEHYRI